MARQTGTTMPHKPCSPSNYTASDVRRITTSASLWANFGQNTSSAHYPSPYQGIYIK